MIIHIPDLKTRNPYISIALEEALAFYFSRNPDVNAILRFWFNPPTIVLGRSCKVLENVTGEILTKIHASHQQNKFLKNRNTIYLTRRLSGGGTVYHSYGNLNYTIMVSLKKHTEFLSIPKSYEILLNLVIRALQKQNIRAKREGLSDLVLEVDKEYKKFSGNSQFRKYGMLVHHGTLLMNKSMIEEIANILKHPPKEPEYRQKRSHKDFLTALPGDFDISLFYDCLLENIQEYFQDEQLRFITQEESLELKKIVRDMVKNVYTHPDWIYAGKYTRSEIIIDY